MEKSLVLCAFKIKAIIVAEVQERSVNKIYKTQYHDN